VRTRGEQVARSCAFHVPTTSGYRLGQAGTALNFKNIFWDHELSEGEKENAR
jgi:hypothetical protein